MFAVSLSCTHPKFGSIFFFHFYLLFVLSMFLDFLALQDSPGSSSLLLAPKESAIFPRCPGSFNWRIVIKTKFWTWGVFIALECLCPFSEQSNGNVCMCVNLYVYISINIYTCNHIHYVKNIFILNSPIFSEYHMDHSDYRMNEELLPLLWKILWRISTHFFLNVWYNSPVKPLALPFPFLKVAKYELNR